MSQSEDQPQELDVEVALAEYMSQCDSGSIPDREAFLAKHPGLREKLEEILHAADWIEELAGPTIADLAFSQEEVPPDVDETLPHFKHFVAEASAENTIHSFPRPTLQGEQENATENPMRELSQPVLPCQFGDYVLERVLGRGGMGVVYFGRQVHLDRPVAIKMIRSGALASEEEVQRFYAEARSAAQLDHPSIVTVYQCGEQDGHRFFSMDYVEGTDLARVLNDGPLEVHKAVRYVRDAARAIQYAHARGILHRDLKPANVLVSDDDEVHITDFGLAKSIGTDTGLTATGAALGTPSYMSPEQAAGRVDEQHHGTDVYSLGAILFALVTGAPPFRSKVAVQTIMQVIHRPAPLARTIKSEVSQELETIIDVCLQKSPDKRYESAGALADDLDRFLNGAPIQARPMPRIRRAWYWLLGIPIFGAVLDNRVIEPTEAHRWVQRGLISIALLLFATWMVVLIAPVIYQIRMPRTVRVASGMLGGNYSNLGLEICEALEREDGCNALSLVTAGSNENWDMLANGEAELALVQADALEYASFGPEAIRIVAPLYYEAIHIFAKKSLNLESLNDLSGRSVLVGPDKAGSHGIARLLLGSAGLTFDDIEVDTTEWHELLESHESDAAIVVSKLGAEDVAELLCEGAYELVPMRKVYEFMMDEPSFRPMVVTSEHYPECNLPDAGIATVVMPAFLAAKLNTPSVLIRRVLEHLFTPEVVISTGIISAEKAAHWQVAWHPAAREFFQAYRGMKPAEIAD